MIVFITDTSTDMTKLLTVLLLNLGLSLAYNLTCPDESQWSIRARLFCPDPSKYSCLWDDNAKAFKENCTKFDLARPGMRIVIRGNWDDVLCPKGFYQPYRHFSNRSSGCIYKRSLCNEEGQVVYDDTDTMEDTKCTCDYTRGYDFITIPNDTCYCIPAKEDCSCYFNHCMRPGIEAKSQCNNAAKLANQHNCVPLKNSDEDKGPIMENEEQTRNNEQKSDNEETKYTVNNLYQPILAYGLLVCFVGVLVIWCYKDSIQSPRTKKTKVTRPLVDVTCDEGDECRLSCELSKPCFHIQWFKDGIYMKDADFMGIIELIIYQVVPEDTGVYELRHRGRTITKASVTVIPVSAVQPFVDITHYEGDTCTLQCELSKSKRLVYWYKDGSFIAGTDNINKTVEGCLHTLTIKYMTETDGGLYELRIGERTITHAFVTFKSLSILGLDSQECIEGDHVEFTCEISDTELKATWYKEGEKIEGTHNFVIDTECGFHRLSILDPVISDSGNYSIQVRNIKRTANLTVKAFIKTHVVNTVIMEGLDVCLSCEAEKGGILPMWYKDGEKIHESENVIIEESEGVYKLTIVSVDLEYKGKYKIDIDGHTSEALLDVKEIPEVLRRMTKKDRDAFLEAAKAGTAPRYYIRIMIVGESGVGKTCLLRRLLNEGIDDVISTDGINIEVRNCRIDLETRTWIFTRAEGKTFTTLTKEEEQYADCGFWDFAGQKEYYATHQTFLSSNAIYVLAVDLSKDWSTKTSKAMSENEFITIGEYIEFWLDNIHCYVSDADKVTPEKALNPPVMIVGTGTDKIDKDSLTNRINHFENYLDELLQDQEKRKHIKNRLYVSNKSVDKCQFAPIRDNILDLAQQMPKWGEHLPYRWVLLEQRILDIKENVVSYNTVHSLASECSLPVKESDSELDAFLRYEHEIGNIIFFDSIREYIILDPKWLVDAFRCLVAPQQFQNKLINLTELRRSGKISDEIIKELFQKEPKLRFFEHKPFLLTIMEKFDILVMSPFEKEKSDHYYMPCMINATPFEDVCEKLRSKVPQCKRTSWFCLDFAFLPPGFFNHVLVSYIRKYPLAMESESRPALYRGIGIFNLIENGCKKIALCISTNTIAIQIWDWNATSEGYYDKLRLELLEIVDAVQKRYRIHIEYTENLKCSEGQFYESIGKLHPEDVINCTTYYCDDHHSTHESKDVYLSWFSETEMKKEEHTSQDRNRENEDTRFGKRCTTCNSGPSMYWCFECKTSLCNNCNSLHNKHHRQHVEDKYIYDYTFDIDVADIKDIKVVSDELLCMSDYTGEQLVTVNITDRTKHHIPLHAKPSCITVVDNSTVAVLLGNVLYRTKIAMVDIIQRHIIKRIDVKVHCDGIIYSNNQLFVDCIDKTIKVLSMSGEITRTIPLSFIPVYICGSDDGSIYCTDYDKLYCIDTEGKLLFTFTHPDMDSPRSITIDDTGHVLVYYRSDSILSISPDLKQSQVIVTRIPRGSYFPHICYIPQSKSIVCWRKGVIDVYKQCNGHE